MKKTLLDRYEDEILASKIRRDVAQIRAIKKLDKVSEQQIFDAFKRNDLKVYTNPDDFKNTLFSLDFDNSALLLMSSGNYGGLDLQEVKTLIE